MMPHVTSLPALIIPPSSPGAIAVSGVMSRGTTTICACVVRPAATMVMVVVPGASALTMPKASTTATDGSDELNRYAKPETNCPFTSTTAAWICTESPTTSVSSVGATTSASEGGGATTIVASP